MPELPAGRHAQFGVFTMAQANDAGISRHQVQGMLRSGALIALRRAAYVAASELAVLNSRERGCARAVAACLVRNGSVVSHHSAAKVHDLPLLGMFPAQPSLLLRSDGRSHAWSDRSVLIRTARLPEAQVQNRGGWRVTSPARTVCDLARTIQPGYALAAMDAALHRRLTQPADLERTRLDMGRCPGNARIRSLCDMATRHAESPYESLARWQLADDGSIQAQPQVWAYDKQGPIGSGDLWIDRLWTFVEVDGDVKYAERGSPVLVEEKRRQERLEEAGFGVARVAPSEVARADLLRERVRLASRRGLIARRAKSTPEGWVGPPPDWAIRGSWIEQHSCDGGHEKLLVDGHETARWRT